MLHKMPRLKKITSLLLTFALTVALALSATTSAMADDKQKDLEAQKQQTEKELQAVKDELSQIQGEKADAEATKDKLQQQTNLIAQNIQQVGAQIEEIQNQIDAKQTEIDTKQGEVEAKQVEIDERWGDFKERMSSMQMLNDRGSLSILSSASNLYELLTFSQTIEDIATKDQEIVGEMREEYKQLGEQKQALENAKTELESVKATYEEKNNELTSKKAEFVASIKQQDATISQSEAEEDAKQVELNSKQQEFDEAANALDSYLRQMIANTQNNYKDAPISCSMNFICPLDSYKYISCYFGSGGHGGVDFAAAGGTAIHAAASGVVTNATFHSSYGNYVMVYHGTADDGNTYATLYAHMVSAPSVSVGQTVSQGDILGYVGSTGNSTGNHLHLEMRVNGARTNALNYVPS